MSLANVGIISAIIIKKPDEKTYMMEKTRNWMCLLRKNTKFDFPGIPAVFPEKREM
jgi:hypothetical protein